MQFVIEAFDWITICDQISSLRFLYLLSPEHRRRSKIWIKGVYYWGWPTYFHKNIGVYQISGYNEECVSEIDLSNVTEIWEWIKDLVIMRCVYARLTHLSAAPPESVLWSTLWAGVSRSSRTVCQGPPTRPCLKVRSAAGSHTRPLHQTPATHHLKTVNTPKHCDNFV